MGASHFLRRKGRWEDEGRERRGRDWEKREVKLVRSGCKVIKLL